MCEYCCFASGGITQPRAVVALRVLLAARSRTPTLTRLEERQSLSNAPIPLEKGGCREHLSPQALLLCVLCPPTPEPRCGRGSCRHLTGTQQSLQSLSIKKQGGPFIPPEASRRLPLKCLIHLSWGLLRNSRCTGRRGEQSGMGDNPYGLSPHPRRASLGPHGKCASEHYAHPLCGGRCLPGALGPSAQHLSLHPICLPSRCTRPSTSPSLPWPTPRAVCSISAAVPFGNYSARSAFTSCPCYRCQSPCKITSFWNQRVFCTENQSVGTKAPDLTAALRGGLHGGKPVRTRGRPGGHLPRPLVVAQTLLSLPGTLGGKG